MIQLHSDCLVFEHADGSQLALSGVELAHELFGSPDLPHGREVLDHAAAAVVYFFKHELGRDAVTVGEFTLALERVLAGVGLKITSSGKSQLADAPTINESDLRQLAAQCGVGYELAFFPLLRAELQRSLQGTPSLVRFLGLHECVKQLLGARRWSQACQRLSDQIADYLRECLVNESKPRCALMVC